MVSIQKAAFSFLQKHTKKKSERRVLHYPPRCLLPNCRYHILLLINVEELLQKLDPLCFTYQHVVCLYTLFKYRFKGILLSRVVKCLILCKEESILNKKQGSRQNDQHLKKRLLRRKYRKHLLSSFQKTKSTQTSGSVIAERIKQVKKTKDELELIKSVDCLLDGYGSYCSKLVTFEIKSL